MLHNGSVGDRGFVIWIQEFWNFCVRRADNKEIANLDFLEENMHVK